MPAPYSAPICAAFAPTWTTRWLLLSASEWAYWIRRCREGISPYSRVRAHAIRLQLDAIIALALRCGLRRGEILGLTEMWMHHDNGHLLPGSERKRRGSYSTATSSVRKLSPLGDERTVGT